MNMTSSYEPIEDGFCSIPSDILKMLPKKGLKFSLYRINTETGKYYPITVPGTAISHTERQTICTDCDCGYIFIKNRDLHCCKEQFSKDLGKVVSCIGKAIPDHELASLLVEGLKSAAATVYNDSVKLNFDNFHATLRSVGELLHQRPQILWLMIPLLDRSHSLVNKSVSTGIIGAAVILLGRDLKPDLNVFIDAISALFLCDIGLSHLPEFVLGKEFCLSRDEQKRIRQHPIGSVEILGATKKISKTTLRAILEHHERMDGSGYPRGVGNEQLSWLGKLCGAVDSFVAMTMERPGKKRMPIVNSLKILYKESSQYDPNIIYALEKVTYRE